MTGRKIAGSPLTLKRNGGREATKEGRSPRLQGELEERDPGDGPRSPARRAAPPPPRSRVQQRYDECGHPTPALLTLSADSGFNSTKRKHQQKQSERKSRTEEARRQVGGSQTCGGEAIFTVPTASQGWPGNRLPVCSSKEA